MGLLERINTPEELKQLRVSELKTLAGELRDTIVEVVSQNGGHLASSLGSVELAIALHYVFDSPKDKIIWDVGHQAYAHKLLTGRKDRFPTLRRQGGISGFTRVSESPHDALTTGHSSTSISAGLGMACGKSLKKDKGNVICVIGDGSMTAGLAYEGLNQAGDLQKRMIVILNDNDMSISPNVGALSSFLSRTFSARYMQDFRHSLKEFLKSLPKIGGDLYEFTRKSKDSFKTFVTPGMLFEAFNFEYFGPIDGHRLNHLIEILENIKHMDEPLLLHVLTKKGKGYSYAENNPTYYHGVGCFEVKTGNCIGKSSTIPSYTQVFGETMVEMAASDEKIVAVTAAMPEGTGLVPFSKKYPDRFFDVGIAEQHGVTFAAGLALEGCKPVVAIYSTFLQRAYDQVLHDVCIENLPVVFAIDRGGIVGEDGPTHHGLFDLSYLRSLPNMVVMSPKDENELKRMLVTAVEHPGPVAVRYPRGAALGVEMEKPVQPMEIGKAEVLKEGTDVLILGIGYTVNQSLLASEILEKQGILASVANCRFVKPLDEKRIVELVRAVPRVITVEENVRQGGFGSAVLECLSDAGVTGFCLKRVGIPDAFVEHGPQAMLRKKYGIDAAGIAEAAGELVKETARDSRLDLQIIHG